MWVNHRLADRAVASGDSLAWIPWPGLSGVDHKTFERFGVAAAVFGTYIVRLQGGASLPSQALVGCEDVFVLDGEVSDQHDFCVAGTYVHSPPGSKHHWRSESGCTLLLKTRPTGDHDRYRVAVDTGEPASWRRGHWPGLQKLRLRELACSRVGLLVFEPGTRIDAHLHVDGEEFYVLSGALQDEDGTYEKGTWVRQPPDSSHTAVAIRGCRMLTTAGHLPPTLIERVRD